MCGAGMIDTKKHRARILALTIAMAAFGCGDGGQSNINPVGGYGRIRLDKDTQTGTVLPRSPFEGGPWYVPVDAP